MGWYRCRRLFRIWPHLPDIAEAFATDLYKLVCPETGRVTHQALPGMHPAALSWSENDLAIGSGLHYFYVGFGGFLQWHFTADNRSVDTRL